MATFPDLSESESDADDEEGRVLGWRCEELRRAGYSLGDALLLAITPQVDLHLARELVARGCPNATALNILL
jgi:hypothetical protein